MEKECKKHGLTEYVKRTNDRWRCKRCAIDAVNKRRRKLKQLSVDYKGGKCFICGYNKCVSALEFHHINPLEKDFSISTTGNTKSWNDIKIELDKCILLCSNCHREEHEELRIGSLVG